MKAEEIIKGYMESNTKSNYVNKMSKEMGVPKSQIICELFKSGYKYTELQRMMPNDYAAAEKKYQKYLDEGVQEEEIQPDPEDEYTEQDSAIAKLSGEKTRLEIELDVAKKTIDSLENDKAELKKENEELKSSTSPEKYIERIRGLEAEVEESEQEKTRNEQLYRETQKQLEALVSDRDEKIKEIKELETKLEEARLRAAVSETDHNAESEIIIHQHEKIKSLEKKLGRAERVILESVYRRFESEDCQIFEEAY